MERAASTSILPVDPFQFRDGIIPDDELATIRSRRKGKNIAKYQKRQNDVRRSLPSLLIPSSLITTLLSSSMTSSNPWKSTQKTQSKKRKPPDYLYVVVLLAFLLRGIDILRRSRSLCMPVLLQTWHCAFYRVRAFLCIQSLFIVSYVPV